MHLSVTCLLLLVLTVSVVQSAKKAGKIIGGSPASPHEFPFFVVINVKYPGWNNWRFRCGGTIINKNTVVTTAACLLNTDGLQNHEKHKDGQQYFQVVAGPHQYSDILNPSSQTQTFETSYKIHNCYYQASSSIIGRTGPHDLAVLTIRGSFTFNEYVQAIELPQYSDNGEVEANSLWIVGFGVHSSDIYARPKVLQKVEVPLINKHECQSIYDVLWKWNHRKSQAQLTEGQFCASDSTRGRTKGVCWGDSGGGLYEKRGGKWIFQGILAFFTFSYDVQQYYKHDCLMDKVIPDVHSKMNHYSCWVQNPQNWGNCDPNSFGSACQVATKPTTQKTTTKKPAPGTTTTTEAPETTTEEFDVTTDDEEDITTGVAHLFPNCIFGILLFLMAILLPKFSINF